MQYKNSYNVRKVENIFPSFSKKEKFTECLLVLVFSSKHLHPIHFPGDLRYIYKIILIIVLYGSEYDLFFF